MPLLAYASVTNVCFCKNVRKRGMVAVHFIPNYNKQEGIGIFIYTPSILDNKLLLSNMIDRKATQAIAKIFYQAIVD